MTDLPLHTAKAGTRSDRRSGRDRRRADKGSAAGRDRRVSVEPRQPDVHELELSIEEWNALGVQLGVHGAAQMSAD